jgi:predicted glycosyltransferase
MRNSGDFLEDQFDDLFGDGHSATAEKEIDEHELLDMQQMIADAELENLNIDSEVFEQLPSEIQMEILMRLKQLKKTQSRVMMRRVSGVELVCTVLLEGSL